ncbi:hypothetical protein J2W46_006030 [Paraburkholderia strydomiana]|nr:hypothetical protein [Paraburkholderia strydomiana]
MSKRGGAPAALMRGRREGCEKRLPRQCEALERWRSRTLSGASSMMKARERGGCARCALRVQASKGQQPEKSAQPPTPHKARYFHTASSAEQTHLSPTGRQNATFRRAWSHGLSAPRLCYSASQTIIFGHLPLGAFVSFPASFPRQYKRPRCPGAACRGIGSGALRFEPCASVDGHTYRSRRLP